MPSKANFLAEGSIFRGEKVGGVCSKSWGSTQKLCMEARDMSVKLVENILWHFQQKETRESLFKLSMMETTKLLLGFYGFEKN